MKQSERKMNKKISPFVSKLISILENEKNQRCMSWVSQGTFMITDSDELSKNVLRQYFKHSNFSSFIRQLNIYGFEKVKSQQNCHYYHHKSFIPTSKKQLKQIKRKHRKIESGDNEKQREGEKSEMIQKNSTQIQVSIRELKKQNEKIKTENKMLSQKILTIEQQNRLEVQKILEFLNQLNKKYMEKLNSDQQIDKDTQAVYQNISKIIVNQIEHVKKSESCMHKINFDSIFMVINSIVEGLQLKQKTCKTSMEEQGVKQMKQIQILPQVCREEQNKPIFDDEYAAGFCNQSQCLNIDNIF